jgi:diacylglycerol kinase
MSEPSLPRKSAFRDRVRSFRCAARGLFGLIRSEHNARLHLAATIIVCALAAWLRVTVNDWCWLAAAITMVWTAEALNTALERLADAATPEFHPLVGQAKDLAAAAVLIAALGAAVIGVLVLGPPLIKQFTL